ncbi:MULTISPECIES: caspase family protein [unclassified Bradyrhizobium]|uniref:caspase family protein n=1 Tax=unclassified Bradyrhizobium TaxID=2631580 RepID=UPI0028EA4288|nr:MULTISPECIES: caspase family protein [unclassified Bradyrhizobium]
MRILKISFPMGLVLGLLSASAGAEQSDARFVVQTGHRLNLITADMSPNGQTLVTGSADESVKVWDVSSDMEVRSLPFNAGPVGKVRVSHSGKYVAVASNSNGTVQVWEIQSGTLFSEMTLAARYITGIEWAPDDLQLAIGISDYNRSGHSLALAVVSKTPKVEIVNTTGDVATLRYSPNGSLLAVGIASSSTITIVPARDGLALRDLPLPKTCTPEDHQRKDANWHGKINWYDGETKIAVACGATLHIMDSQSGAELSSLPGAAGVREVMLLEGGGYILVREHGFDAFADAKHEVHEFASLRYVTSSSNQRYLLYFTSSSVVIVEPMITRTVTRQVTTRRTILDNVGNLEKYGSIAASPRGSVFATGGLDGVLNIWSGLPSGPLSRRAQVWLGNRIRALTFDAQGQRIIYSTEDKLGTIRLGANVPAQSISLEMPIRELAPDPAGTGNVAALAEKKLLMFKSDPLQLVDQADAPTIRNNWGGVGLAWLSDGTLVTASDTSLIYWRGMRDKQYMNMDTSITSAAAGEGTRFYLGSGTTKFLFAKAPQGARVESFDFRTGKSASKDARSMIFSMETDALGPRVVTASEQPSRVRALAFEGSRRLLASGAEDGKVTLFRLPELNRLKVLDAGAGDVTDLAFLAGGNQLLSYGLDGATRIWDMESLRLAATVFSQGDRWTVATPEGMFDTNAIEESQSAGWVLPDEPLRAWPLTIFMRQYYEPHLLSKVLNRERLRPVPNISEVNHRQPELSISDVQIADRTTGALSVTVRAHMPTGRTGASDASRPQSLSGDGIYDMRVFRNGQIVGQWPPPPDPTAKTDPNDVVAWREMSRLPTSGKENWVEHTFRVALPSVDLGKPVTLTAYAFNEDRVKSETAKYEFAVPNEITSRQPRVYVIAIGVNAYTSENRTLRFAVRDAEVMRESLSRLDGYKVVPVTLTSEGRDPTRWFATKANIRAVLSRLAGKPIAPGALVGVEGADQLAQATPDDLVIVTFSGHGYTARDGAFYLLPADSGEALDPAGKPEVLARFISSEELSSWLRPIDAGQMAMIIDACHSAASVDQPGFKPGPMGDRGLGQLAYDKAMRILAASQADDVALESEKLKQGLLTYALVHDGLALGQDGRYAADANHDGKLTLAEWLRYGEQHTPALFEDIRAGRKDAVYVGRDSVVAPGFETKVADHAQTPSLFDFARQDEVALRLGAN